MVNKLPLPDGVAGVFDIKDLVEVLRKENAKDIFVCRVPKEFKYVDFMVVVTGEFIFGLVFFFSKIL